MESNGKKILIVLTSIFASLTFAVILFPLGFLGEKILFRDTSKYISKNIFIPENAVIGMLIVMTSIIILLIAKIFTWTINKLFGRENFDDQI
jgi:hypothetical protein